MKVREEVRQCLGWQLHKPVLHTMTGHIIVCCLIARLHDIIVAEEEEHVTVEILNLPCVVKIEHMSSTEALSFTGYLEIEALKTHGGVYLHVPILDLIDTNNITTQA